MGNMASTTGVSRAPAQRKKGLQPETAIQVGVMNYLRQIMALQKYQRFMAFHVPNGGYRNGKEAGILQDMGVMAGVADLVVLIPPEKMAFPDGDDDKIIETIRPARALFIELKHQPRSTVIARAHRGGKRAAQGQHEAQKDFQARVSALGFDYRLVAAVDARDGLNQVLAILAEYGVKAS